MMLLAHVVAAQSAEQARARPITDQDIGPMVSVAEVDSSGTVTTVELTLTPPPDLRGMPPRLMHNAWLAGPAGGQVTVAVRDAEAVVINEDGTTSGTVSVSAAAAAGMVTAELGRTQVSYLDRFRLVGLHRLEIVVGQTAVPRPGIPVQRLLLTRAKLDIDLGLLPEEAERNAATDPYAVSLVRDLVINPSQVALACGPAERLPDEARLTAWNTMLKEAAERGPLLTARLPRGGLYRLRADDLQAAGVAPEAFPVDRIRIFSGADELVAAPLDIQYNRLVGDGRLVFYVPEDEADRKPFLPLWVFLAPEGETGRRTTAPIRNGGTQVGTAARDTITIFEPLHFNHLMDMVGPQLRWLTHEMRDPAVREYEFQVSDIRNDAPGALTAWLTTLNNTDMASYALLVNDQVVAEGMLRGRRVEKRIADIPPGLLKRGRNTFAVQNREIADPEPGARISLGFLSAQLEMPLLSTGLNPNDSGSLDGVAMGEPVSVAFLAPGKADGDGLVADVTDPLDPTFISMSALNSTRGSAFTATMTFGAATPRVIFSPHGTLLTPVLRQTPAPTVFLDTKPVDYLAIVHPELQEALRPLTEHHAEKRAVETVTVDDVYNAFSYGELRYEAVRDAVAHLYASRSGARLRHVLLVGEASEYWWEYRRSSADVARNMLPVYGWRDANQPIRGDEGYARIQGNGPVLDVELGRISAATPAEVADVVAKTLGYAENPPQGDWLGRHLIVTDDEPEFDSVATEIIAKSFRGANRPDFLRLQDFPYEDYFRAVWRKRSAVMTDRLVEEWSKGALTIAYLGHGGPNLWSGERIFHLRDVARTNVQNRFPIMVAGSCDTGWVDYPLDPAKASLAEMMMRSRDGGSVVAYIPISGTSSFEHNYLMTGFYRSLFRPGPIDVGTVVTHSKLEYLLYRNNQSVTDQYLLMGDPALPVARVPENLSVRVAPDRLLELTGGELSVAGRADGLEWGLAEATLMDASFREVATERFRIRQGEFSGVLRVPGYLPAGSYQLMVKAHNESEGQASTVYARLPILPHRIRVEWTSNPPAETAPEAGTPTEVGYTVTNDSEVALTQAELVLEDTERGVVVGRHPIRAAAGGQVSRSFPMPMPPGINTLRGRLYFTPTTNEGASRVTLAEGSIMLRGRDRAQEGRPARLVDFSVSQIVLRQRPIDDSRMIMMPIYDMTGGKLPEHLFGGLRLGGADGERLGELQSLEPLRLNGTHQIAISTTTYLQPKEQPFAFELLSDDGGTSRTLQVSLFNLDLSRGPDLEIVDRKIVLENIHPLSGKTLFARFRIRNRGDQPSTQVVTQLYVDEPWNEEKVAPNVVPWAIRNTVEKLDPGEEREMRLRWDHQGAGGGNFRLFATVSSRDTMIEPNMANNEAMIPVSLLPPPNLAIDAANVIASRNTIRPYERVTVTVPISNNSKFDFLRDFKVTASVLSFDGTSRRIFRQDFGEMKAGEAAAMQFDWLVKPGEYQISVDLNEDREYLEQTYADNVHKITFTYRFDEKIFREPGEMWDFSELPAFGTSQGLLRESGGRMTVALNPNVPTQVLPMAPEFLVEGRLGPSFEMDNLFGTTPGGGLFISYGERPEPVKFHYTINAAEKATWYDVLLTTIGPRYPERMSGHFRYRLQNETEWREINGEAPGLLKLGRIQTADDELTIEFAPPPYATLTNVWDLAARPVIGIYESPVISAERFPQGPVLVDASTPGGSRVDVEVRFGHGPAEAIIWSEWLSAPAGNPTPSPVWSDSRFFQWRARAIATPEGSPSFSAVRFAMKPQAPPDQVAAQ